MAGNIPKPLRLLNNKPLLQYSIENLDIPEINEIIVVKGHQGHLIEDFLQTVYTKTPLRTAHQPVQDGTVSAIRAGLAAQEKNNHDILIAYADDSALYSETTIRDFIEQFEHTKLINPVRVMLKSQSVHPELAGIEVKNNLVIRVVKRDELAKKKIQETYILCGLMMFRKETLEDVLPNIAFNINKKEFLFTDFINLLGPKDLISFSSLTNDYEWNSVNTEMELLAAERKLCQ